MAAMDAVQRLFVCSAVVSWLGICSTTALMAVFKLCVRSGLLVCIFAACVCTEQEGSLLDCTLCGYVCFYIWRTPSCSFLLHSCAGNIPGEHPYRKAPDCDVGVTMSPRTCKCAVLSVLHATRFDWVCSFTADF